MHHFECLLLCTINIDNILLLSAWQLLLVVPKNEAWELAPVSLFFFNIDCQVEMGGLGGQVKLALGRLDTGSIWDEALQSDAHKSSEL